MAIELTNLLNKMYHFTELIFLISKLAPDHCSIHFGTKNGSMYVSTCVDSTIR
jgi:hypothetical protein